MKKAKIFPWNENFITHVSLIDEQHKKLVQLVNDLADHLVDQENSLALSDIFDELADYAVYHFQAEEEIWHRYLPHDSLTIKHDKTHAGFLEAIKRLHAGKQAKPLNKIVEDILIFLTHWLAFHILDNDKRMAKIVLALQSGMSLTDAKLQAEHEMSGAYTVLIKNILHMYSSLCESTLHLMKEVIARQKAEAKLHLAANVFNNTQEAICITDSEGHVVDANPPFCQMAEISYEEILTRNLRHLKSGLLEKQASDVIWSTVNDQGHWSGEIWNRSQSGALEVEWLTLSAVKDESGKIINYVGIFSSVGQMIKRSHELEVLASHDALTGLPNRLLLVDRLEHAMVQTTRLGKYLAICYLDLDGFKPVNDRFGHEVGDRVLIEIARRLKHVLRSNDTVARMGGDEFVILLEDLYAIEESHVLLTRLLNVVEEIFYLQKDQAVQVSASIGVTVYPTDQAHSTSLIEHADQALYQAKRSGKARYHFYQADI